MKPLYLIAEDVATMRGIIALLEGAPATTREVSMTQHVGSITAGRCCRALQEAGIITHPIVTRTVIGVPTQVPQLEWHLTTEYRRGDIDYPTIEQAVATFQEERP